MKRRALRALVGIALSLLIVVAGLAIYTMTHISPAAPVYEPDAPVELHYRLRTAEEHDAARSKNGGNPYILAFDVRDGGSLLYYGASHTNDPGDPQIRDITTHWDAFKPSVALYEGRRRNFVYGALIEPFAGLPEPALVHKLARRDDVPLYSLEPAYEDEVAQLIREFSAERIALYFFMRVYSSEAGGVANDALATDLLAKRTNVNGLRGSIPSLDALDRIWERDFPGAKNWRTLRGEPGYLAEISHASRRIRGEHMARILIDLVRKGERVFAVVGSGHVIRQEWNLRAALNQEPAWDQPIDSIAVQPSSDTLH